MDIKDIKVALPLSFRLVLLAGFQTNFHSHFRGFWGEIGGAVGGNLVEKFGGKAWKTLLYIKNASLHNKIFHKKSATLH